MCVTHRYCRPVKRRHPRCVLRRDDAEESDDSVRRIFGALKDSTLRSPGKRSRFGHTRTHARTHTHTHTRAHTRTHTQRERRMREEGREERETPDMQDIRP